MAIRRIIKHWIAYQKTALKLKCWHPRFLLHDVDKMIMLLFISKEKTTRLHRIYSTHHIRNNKVIDKMAAIVDWG